MITKIEYDRVQRLLGRKGNPRPKEHLEFAYTGLIQCGECNRMVTAEEKYQVKCDECRFKFAHRDHDACPRCETKIKTMSGSAMRHYTYYHCSKSRRPTCQQKCISEVEIEKQISDYIAHISISVKFKDWAIKYLRELHAQETQSLADIIQTQAQAYRACMGQIEGLVSLKTSPGNKDGSLLSDDEYAKRRSMLLIEKAVLEESLSHAKERSAQILKLSEQVFEFAATVQERFAKGDPKMKKEILNTVASNQTLKDKKLLIEARKPFFILGNELHAEELILWPIEPEEIRTAQRQNTYSIFMRPNVLGDLDDVRTNLQKSQRAAALIYAHFKHEFRPYTQN